VSFLRICSSDGDGDDGLTLKLLSNLVNHIEIDSIKKRKRKRIREVCSMGCADCTVGCADCTVRCADFVIVDEPSLLASGPARA
jgi:hypothetical protein